MEFESSRLYVALDHCYVFLRSIVDRVQAIGPLRQRSNRLGSSHDPSITTTLTNVCGE